MALGIPVGVSRYRMPNKRQKIVHYWSAEATEDAIRASAFVPNKEIAALEWVAPKRALKYLSYPVDVEILENFLRFVDDGILSTFPIVVLRHAKATPREEWAGSDASRPLVARGTRQAAAIAGILQAFGVRKIISSDAVRCVTTVTPLAAALGKQGPADARCSARTRGRKARPTPARSSANACAPASPLSCAATDRSFRRSSANSPWPPARCAARTSAAPRRSRSGPSRSSTCRRRNPGSGIVSIETHVPKL